MADYDLSDLTETLYQARDQVAREQVGIIPSATINGGSEGVSLGGTVESLRTVQPVINDEVTPSMSIPDGDNIKPEVDTMTITKTANVKIPLTGESWKKLMNTAGRVSLTNTFAQAIRGMVNEIEAYAGIVIKNGSSRACGTAGTTPFAADFNLVNSLYQILEDNGCPMNDGQRSLVINSNAGTKLRNLSQLTKANEAGSTDPLRKGALLDIAGFGIKSSAGIARHTKGTGAGYLVDLVAGYESGDKAIHIDTGAGTIVAGDVLALESDTNLYVVNTGCAGDGDQDIVIARPGLRQALANNKTVTVGNNYTANLGFHKTAVEVVMRPPSLPGSGDAAADRVVLYDEESGLSFDVALYLGYKKVMYDITCYYDVKVWVPEFVATLMG